MSSDVGLSKSTIPELSESRESWSEILQGQGQEEDSLSASRQGRRIRREQLQSLQMLPIWPQSGGFQGTR